MRRLYNRRPLQVTAYQVPDPHTVAIFGLINWLSELGIHAYVDNGTGWLRIFAHERPWFARHHCYVVLDGGTITVWEAEEFEAAYAPKHDPERVPFPDANPGRRIHDDI